MADYKELADLIFPNVNEVKYYEEKYPEEIYQKVQWC